MQATSDILGPSFDIIARYMLIDGQRIPDILAVYMINIVF